MFYYWWIIYILLYIFVLILYTVIMEYVFDEPFTKLDSAKTVFFAVTSIITLSVVHILKINLYRNDA